MRMDLLHGRFPRLGLAEKRDFRPGIGPRSRQEYHGLGGTGSHSTKLIV